MALRSVVIEPDSPSGGPRRTVVLREGGPKPRGGFIDVAACILGVLLLVGSVALVQYLPEKEYTNPRYKLFFPAGSAGILASPSFDFVEGTEANTHLFVVPIALDNVVSISITVGFKDDMAASLPDSFRVTLFDPLGNQIGQPEFVENADPTESSDPRQPYVFVASQTTHLWTLSLSPLPQDEIVEAASRKETQSEALLRLEPKYHSVTKGDWTIKVELLNAGDCPQNAGPDPDQRLARQAFACANQQEPRQNTTVTDVGNYLDLEFVSWAYFVTCTEITAFRDPKPLPSCK